MAARKRPINPAFDPFGVKKRRLEPEEHACAIPGCPNPGEHRAPRDRTLSDYMWLCLPHVQEFNKNWNYYAGMTAEDIEAELQRDTIWQRPTWKLGERSAGGRHNVNVEDLDDPMDIFAEERAAKARAYQERERRRRQGTGTARDMAEQAREAMHVLGLEPPLAKDSLKARYKELVKKYHPDVTGGDKLAEERFKTISVAYRVLVESLKVAEKHDYPV